MKTRKELLKSPVRAGNDINKEYDATLIIPAGTKHERGPDSASVEISFEEKERSGDEQ